MLVLALSSLPGCGRDYKEEADQSVVEDLLGRGQKFEAIAFFEQGGTFYDMEDDPQENAKVDQEILLPMLKSLHSAYPTQQWVVPEEGQPKVGFALLIELPSDNQQVDAMARIVEAADAKFDGLILQQWGHRWLSIDLLDKETYEFHKKSDPEIDIQR